MQCACAILSSVACPALQYFSTLSHRRYDTRKNVTEHKMCVLISSTNLSETFLVLRRNDRDMIKSVLVFMYSSRCSCPILMKLEFFQQIFEKFLNIKLQETPSTGSRVVPCGRTDRRADKKLIVAFGNFANSPEKWQPILSFVGTTNR